jgi:Thioredoxin-like
MSRKHSRVSIYLATLLTAGWIGGVCRAQQRSLTFPPFEQWKNAVLSHNTGALQGLYSQSPPARVMAPGGKVDTEADIAYWTRLKIRELEGSLIPSEKPQPGVEEVLMEAEIRPATGSGARVMYLSAIQLWQEQNGQWRLVAAQRTGPLRLQQPASIQNKIYPAGDAHEEIQRALAEAAKEHERVLVVFGADWCYDCHVLDLAFHRPDLISALRGNFKVVHVDVGEGDKNQDLMRQYQVPMKKGIPALAVLASDGKLLYSQQNGEFENARALGPEDLLAFLNKWKPTR